MNNQQGGGMITAISSWFAQPFNSSGSVLNWVLFLGLIIIAVFFWTRVLSHIEE